MCFATQIYGVSFDSRGLESSLKARLKEVVGC